MKNEPGREEAILNAALRLSSAEELDAYLKEACRGDDHLRRRVEVLLKAHEQSDNLLKQPPAAASAETLVVTTGVVPVTEKSGDKIGHYKLLQQIGEGGCGVVYMAEMLIT